MSSPHRYDVAFGATEENVWAYSPTVHRYIQSSAGDATSDVLMQLHDRHYKFFRRFEGLDHLGAATEINRQRDRWTLIRTKPPDGDYWSENLWVDENRSMVMKSVFRKVVPAETLVTTTVWRNIHLNGPLDPVIFGFLPPRDATRTNSLEIP